MDRRRHLLELTAPDTTGQVRLDAVLRAHCPELSRRDVAHAIAEGLVSINGRAARKGTRVGPGDRITVERPALASSRAAANLAVLYTDADLLAVDKPPGLAASARHLRGVASVAAALLAREPGLSAVADTPLDAGLVHRLDTGTSGVLLAARTRAAWQHLRRQFRARTVEKEYLALVSGRLASARRLTHRLAHAPGKPARMEVARPGGGRRVWSARADLRPLASTRGFSFVGLRLATGVTHQLRVQLAAIGHPIAGDTLYGGPPVAGIPDGRLLLHASRLVVQHPGTGSPLEVTSPVPRDFRRALDALGLDAPGLVSRRRLRR